MASLNDLGVALQNADAAGDTEAAKSLAAEIMRQRQAAAPASNPLSDAWDEVNGFVQRTGTAITRGIGNMIGSPRNTLEGLRRNVEMNPSLAQPFSAGDPSPDVGLLPDPSFLYSKPATDAYKRIEPNLPTPQQGQDFLFKKLGLPEVNATTPLGKVWQDAVTTATPAVLAGPAAAVTAAAGGAAASTARQMGASPGTQALLNVGVPLLAGGVTASVGAFRPSPQRLGANMVRGLTGPQLTQATALMNEARARGTTLSWPEAFAQVTGGGAKRALDVQRVVEQSAGGADVMNNMLRQRAPGNAQAMQRQLDQLAPMPQGLALSDVPHNVQDAAEKAVIRIEQARSAAVNPNFTAAAGNQVPLATMQGIIGRIDAAIAAKPDPAVVADLQRVRAALIDQPARPGTPASRAQTGGTTQHPIFTYTAAVPATPEVPKTRIDMLNSVRKVKQEDVGLPRISMDNLSKESRHALQPILDSLDRAMRAASAPYRQGNDLYGRLSRDIVDPVTRSGLGQLAESKPATLEEQRAIISPQGEQGTVDPALTHFVARRLAVENPVALRDWVRVSLESQFSEANKGTQGQPAGNVFGGAKYRAKQLGNADKALNTEALIRSLPGGDNVWVGYRRLMQIFEAQGYRQNPGSMTEFNKQITAELEGSGVSLDPKLLTRLSGLVQRVRYGRNSAEMARMITDPNMADLWARLALLPPNYAARIGAAMGPGALGAASNAIFGVGAR